jgi:hypothetical protein
MIRIAHVALVFGIGLKLTLNQRVQDSSPCAPTKFPGRDRGVRFNLAGPWFESRNISEDRINQAELAVICAVDLSPTLEDFSSAAVVAGSSLLQIITFPANRDQLELRPVR